MAAELDRRQFLKLSLTALAATTLSATQVGWLINESEKPEIIGVTDFQKYLVSEINKMPEKEVGRVIRIETTPEDPPGYFLMRGLSVKRNNKAKYWHFIFDPENVKGLSFRKAHVARMAEQLRLAFTR